MWRYPLTQIDVTEADVSAVLECLEGGWLTMGPRTQEFEAAVAREVGSSHAVAVCNGTAALHLAMLAAGVREGDEVIVPALTFVATAAAVRYVGATPVFCDIASRTDLNIDPEAVVGLITPRTRAVAAVHFMGYPAAVDLLRGICDEHGLRLIEDAAQGFGARIGERSAGTIGDVGCFSFFSKKQLCVGEGGMLVTDDEALASTARRLRSHGMTSVTWDRHRGHAQGYDIVDIGWNYRLDEPRAALGLSRLPRVASDIASRRESVARYRCRLDGHQGIELAWDELAVGASSHFAFPVLLQDREHRDALRKGLQKVGIQTTFYPSLTVLSAYEASRGVMPLAEEAGARHCALPLWAHMQPEDVDEVADAVIALAEPKAAGARAG